MHATHSTGELITYAIALAVVLAFVFAIVQVIDRLFRGAPAPQIDEEQLHFQRVKATRRQLPDGSWVEPKIEWAPCDAPMAPNDTEPHFPNDKEHVRNCARCQSDRVGWRSGVAHRSSLS